MRFSKLINRVSPLVFLVLTCAASAHDTWLVQGSGAAKAGADHQEIALALTTGAQFPALGTPSNPVRILRASLIAEDVTVPLLVGKSNEKSLDFRALSQSNSSVMAVVQLKPSVIALEPDSVKAYMDELGNPASMAAAYKKAGTWRESYTKNAKMWIRVGKAAAPKSLMASMNLPYELVPMQDPSALKSGDSLKMCAFADGKAVPRAYFGIVDAAGKHSNVTSDISGCASFKLSSTSGYLIRGIRIDASKNSELDWESHFASFTVLDMASASSGR